jgi:hypothetical protein
MTARAGDALSHDNLLARQFFPPRNRRLTTTPLPAIRPPPRLRLAAGIPTA